MTWTVDYSGTVTPVIGTETALSVIDTTNGSYQLILDLGNMFWGDAIEVNLYASPLASGALRRCAHASFQGPQANPVKIAWPFSSPQQVMPTIRQIAGTVADTLTGTIAYG